MFTGIITDCARINAVHAAPSGSQLVIQTAWSDLEIGESIAVDGVCLTVTSYEDHQFTCDVSIETLAVTKAASYAVDTRVNLERALRASDRLSGHFVTGHVDQVARVKQIMPHDDYVEIVLHELMPSAEKYLVSKGSITVNGVSLTLNIVTAQEIRLLCIPHTLACTNLHDLCAGDSVNIEYDYLAKLIARQCDVVRTVERGGVYA